jgi:hypothetical protein
VTEINTTSKISAVGLGKLMGDLSLNHRLVAQLGCDINPRRKIK